MERMGLYHTGDFHSREARRDVINSPQLHRFQVALHLDVSRHHYDGQLPVERDRTLKHAPSLEVVTPLAHNDDVKSPRLQLADALSI